MKGDSCDSHLHLPLGSFRAQTGIANNISNLVGEVAPGGQNGQNGQRSIQGLPNRPKMPKTLVNDIQQSNGHCFSRSSPQLPWGAPGCQGAHWPTHSCLGGCGTLHTAGWHIPGTTSWPQGAIFLRIDLPRKNRFHSYCSRYNFTGKKLAAACLWILIFDPDCDRIELS